MIGDTLGDAMEEEGGAEEEELIVGQVLDELGIDMGQDTPSAPMGNIGSQGGRTTSRKAVQICLWLRIL